MDIYFYYYFFNFFFNRIGQIYYYIMSVDKFDFNGLFEK